MRQTVMDLKKGYFPYKFNIKEKENYIGPHPKPYSKKKNDEFLQWYATVSADPFVMQEEIKSYCGMK